MRNAFKRVTAGIVALSMVSGAVPVLPVMQRVTDLTAVTASAYTAGDFMFGLLDDGTAGITQYIGEETVVDIPSELDGHKVTSIGSEAFHDRTSLISVTIPEGVTSIGSKAFRGCNALVSVTVPDSVDEIGIDAFANTEWFNKLKAEDPLVIVSGILIDGTTASGDVVIPDGVTTINDSAFYECAALESVMIPDSVTEIRRSAFYGCKTLVSVRIPDSVAEIGGAAFKGTKWLVNESKKIHLVIVNNILIDGSAASGNIVIPDTVTKISDSAFSDNKYLVSVTIPNSVTKIGFNEFNGCASLRSVTIPDSVTSIGSSAFNGCKNLSSVSLPDSITEIGEGAFNSCASLTSVIIPDGVTKIPSMTFRECTSLISVTIPDSVTLIGIQAFERCTSLSSLTIPDSVTKISGYTFSKCYSLKSITLPDSLTYLGGWAFQRCTSLTSVTIPNSVTSIGTKAFDNCTALAIYCCKDSTAHNYALENNIEYVLLDDDIKNPKIKYEKGYGAVKLEWRAVDGAEQYGIAGYVNGRWTLLDTTEDTAYILSPLNEGEQYKIAVVTKLDGEWLDDFSNAIVVTPKTASVYPKITNVTYSEEYHRIRFTWSPVEGATNYGIAVYLAGKWRIQTQTIAANVTTFTTPKNLTAGKTYTVAVAAKVGGAWTAEEAIKHAVTVTVK